MKILLIEDDPAQVQKYRDKIKKYCDGIATSIFVADSLPAAQMIFPQYPWDTIVVDGCLGPHDDRTDDLVEEMKKTHQGPMLAASSAPRINEELMKRGCTHTRETKDAVGNMLCGIISDIHRRG